MTDIHKESMELWNKFTKGEITQEEFDRQIKMLDRPIEVDWQNEEE